MKTIKYSFIALASLLAFSACSDFEEININQHAVGALDTKPYYALNKSIINDQQNPDTGERVFVINWAAAGRQDGYDGYGICNGYQYDDYNACLYSLAGNTIKSTVSAINLVEEQLKAGVGEHEAEFFPNVRQFARIWRVYLMTEFVDSFGPMPTDGFQGVNPKFASVKDDYYYMFKELAAAVDSINVNVVPTEAEAKCDPAYGYDAKKWKNFGISMWMRIAMRLSEVEPETAKTQFEAAAKAGEGIRTADGTFSVQEKSGWDDLSGVMSRTWDYQCMSATFSNLVTNLGGVEGKLDVKKILADPGNRLYGTKPDVEAKYGPSVKPSDKYLGRDLGAYCEVTTDNPTRGIFFDGIPSYIDPRTFEFFYMAGDYSNRIETGYYPYPAHSIYGITITGVNDAEGNGIEASKFDAKYSVNGIQAGWNLDEVGTIQYGPYGSFNVSGGNQAWIAPHAGLAEKYRNNTQRRVFFGPWETYFLLAEAALRGWTVGIDAEAAYNKGIDESFDYYGLSAFKEDYKNSTTYNRVGTSVKFTHTAEPANTTMEITTFDGKKSEKLYTYPDVNKILYKGKALNDKLTKIITQKFIANTPWLPLENWSDHRRLGLPFWEIPVSTKEMSYLPDWKKTSYQTGQTAGCFLQRMTYPSSLGNADPKEYANAKSLLGGEDLGTTPLWWAIH